MRKEYENLIAATDRHLSELRSFWISAQTKEDTSKWLGKINEQLDERLRLMKCRDSTT